MSERKFAPHVPGIDVGPLYRDRHIGSFGLTGYEVTVFEKPGASRDVPFVIYKGGWGDVDAESCVPLAMQTAEIFGRAAVARNRRLSALNPRTVLAIARARTIRAEAVHAALNIGRVQYGAREAVVAGQSFGGDNAVDSTLFTAQELSKSQRPEKLSVLTIDSPGVYGDLERTESIHGSLIGLAKTILQDFRDYPETGNWLRKHFLKPRSPLETLYFGSEMLSLMHIDVSPSIEMLRDRNIDVEHIFHVNDVVPRVEDPNAGLFEGGHGAALVNPLEIVGFIAVRMLSEHADPNQFALAS